MGFAVKAYVGPCGVKEWAAKLREAGFVSVSDGTEHVYAVAEGSDKLGAAWNASVDFERRFGRMNGIRFTPV